MFEVVHASKIQQADEVKPVTGLVVSMTDPTSISDILKLLDNLRPIPLEYKYLKRVKKDLKEDKPLFWLLVALQLPPWTDKDRETWKIQEIQALGQQMAAFASLVVDPGTLIRTVQLPGRSLHTLQAWREKCDKQESSFFSWPVTLHPSLQPQYLQDPPFEAFPPEYQRFLRTLVQEFATNGSLQAVLFHPDELTRIITTSAPMPGTKALFAKHHAWQCLQALSRVQASQKNVTRHGPLQSQDAEYVGEYLATYKDIIVRQEPCIMCAMALLHSRIRRVFYLRPSPNGGLGSLLCLHKQKDLNHHFAVYKHHLS